MNYRLTLRLIGHVLLIEALFMVIPLIVSFIYGGNDYAAFLWSILILISAGTLLTMLKPHDGKTEPKAAFAAVGLSYLLFSLFGALPFYFSGCFNGFIDCVFESVSGLTTTGASILVNIEALPKGILFWRSLTQWIGGLGVLMFMLAAMPFLNASSANLLRAEVRVESATSPDKIFHKIQGTVKVLYQIYLAMTVLLIALLYISGMPFYDSFIHALSTAGTGGFSNMNASIAAYNNAAAEIILAVFMFLFGISFTLYFFLLAKKFMKFIKDEELRLYFGVIIAAILIITVNISGIYGGFAHALRYSSFQVSSIITTTGFATADFNLWPPLSQTILVLLMITGCCAGSTGGGLKLIRTLILFKAAKIQLGKILNPGKTKSVFISGRKISDETISKTSIFFFIYFAVFTVSVIIVSTDGKDIITGATAVITSLSNVGPGLGAVGPAGNFAAFTPLSKIVLSFCMIAGRLEFFPILILLAPSVWRRRLIK